MSGYNKAEIDGIFNRIYDESYMSVLKYISARTRTAEDAADIVQETYLELYKVLLKNADYINESGAFVMDIAKKKLFKHYTIAEKIKYLFPSRNEDSEDDPLEEAGGFEFEDEVIDKVLLDEVWDYIMKFDETTKQIFILRYSRGRSLEETAKQLGLPLHSVRNKLYRSTEHIKAEFNGKITTGKGESHEK